MAKTRVKNIDDSKPVEEPKSQGVRELKKKAQGRDELVEKLKAELGIEDSSEELRKTQKSSEPDDLKSRASETASSSESFQKERPVAKKEEKKVQPQIGKEKPRSKKYKEAAALVDKNITYSVKEAVDLAKKVSYSKFDGTLELHVNTNVKNLRGLVSLPYASGKKIKVIAFGKGAGESGADIVGEDVDLANIEKGKINFDVMIVTPDLMPKVARLAKVLGPKGLMPNPKNGTIAADLKKAVADIQSGKVEYKTESNKSVMHLGLGKISQNEDELSQNVKVLLSTIGKSKIKKAILSPTMGPGIKLDLASI